MYRTIILILYLFQILLIKSSSSLFFIFNSNTYSISTLNSSKDNFPSSFSSNTLKIFSNYSLVGFQIPMSTATLFNTYSSSAGSKYPDLSVSAASKATQVINFIFPLSLSLTSPSIIISSSSSSSSKILQLLFY